MCLVRLYISLVIPKANTYLGCLSFQFSATNDWNELQKIAEVGDISPSLVLSISYPHVLLTFFCSFAHQYFYLHIIICTSITPVLIY